MATKQELFTKVTGLTFDVEKVTDPTKLAWLVPDGAMLDNPNGRKRIDTKAFLDAARLETTSKIDIYDDEEDNDNNSSSFDE